MEARHTEDNFTIGPDGKPSRVTDYKLYFPADFTKIKKPELSFIVDSNYIETGFQVIPGQLAQDINTLRKQKKTKGSVEWGIVHIRDTREFYKTKQILSGKAGIGFQVIPDLPVSDYLHSHTTHPGEDERSADLFSAFDLWSLGSKGAERYWL